MSKILNTVEIYLVEHDNHATVCPKCDFVGFDDCYPIRNIISCDGGYLTTEKPEDE